jgi:uncharacterized protein (TIGR02271 family)
MVLKPWEVKMSYTVVGLFNNRNQAETAIRELTQRGFVSENIDISSRAASGGASRNTATEEVVITDSVANFFNSLFNNDKKNAGKYANAAADADSIVTVHVGDDERAREAAFVLDKNGAIDIDGTATTANTQNRQNLVETDRGAGNAQNIAQNNNQNNADYQSGTTIPVIEEQLQIDKQVVETGGVRVRSRIVEKPIEENVRLRNQYVIVNRNRVDREVTDEDFSSFREGEIEFLELAEVPVIGKHARVVEEVEIGSRVSEHEETVHETLRSTDVQIEEINRNMPDDDFTTQIVNRSGNS